jgi:hypothetical protein
LLRVQEEPGEEAKAGSGLDEGFEQARFSVVGCQFSVGPSLRSVGSRKREVGRDETMKRESPSSFYLFIISSVFLVS